MSAHEDLPAGRPAPARSSAGWRRLVVVALSVTASVVAVSGQPDAEEPAARVLDRYAQAHRLLAGGEFAAAQAAFDSLPAGFVLDDYAAFFAAESRLRSGDESGALDRFRALSGRFPDSTLLPTAHLAAADTAFRLGHWAEAEREGRRFLARAPTHVEVGRILVRVAEARAAQGQVAEAMEDLRRRWVEAPATSWGDAAGELQEALARLHGLPLAPLTMEERFSRAQRLADASELQDAVRDLEGLLSSDLEPELRLRVLARLLPLLARVGRVPQGIALGQAAVAEPGALARAAVLYELARLHRRVGQPGAAVAVLERLVGEHLDAPGLPDAWLLLGRSRADVGDVDRARGAFHTLIRGWPGSGAATQAGWELGWLEYRGGRFRDAALAFRQLSSGAPSHRLAGLYWAGRALDAAQEKPAAMALYRDVVSRGPHTYYGLLAARRFRGPPPAPVAAPIRLATDPLGVLARDAHYHKGRALWQLGFESHALSEFEVVGREALTEGERAWGFGVVFAQVGEVGRSLRYLRRAFASVAEAGTPGLTAQFWRLLYPFGYAEIVRESAQRSGLDPFFVAAVIREESSYDPRARSTVGAVGLMQLMPETARLVAGETGLRLAEPARLWEPAVNIALGSQYLAQLRTRFQEPLLAVAGYNAGPHRVQRWLGERGAIDLEEFVDQMPFDETRGFVKRVVTSWHQYRRLYTTGASSIDARSPAPRAGR